MASESELFNYSGPLDLTAVDWTHSQHRRSVAASLVQGTYVMEHDRRKKHQGYLALAPPWWEFFHFQLIQVLVDEHDLSIFGAIFQFKFPPSHGNYSGEIHPQYVVAFRGTITKTDTKKQDLKLDFQLILSRLQQSTRFQLAMQAVENVVSIAGAANIWLAGHSLGSAIALVVGKNMVKMGCFIETYLFSPPFTSIPIERIQNQEIKHGIRFATSTIKAGVAIALNSQHQRSQKDDSFNALSSWIPFLFVNPSDPISAEYIGYFEHRQKMVEIGAGKIARIATQNSFGSLISPGMDSEPPHLLPSAYLTINLSPTEHFRQAHGIEQWWKQNINCQFKLY